MLDLSNYILQYSQVDFAQVAAAKPNVFITEAAPKGGTPQLTNAQVAQLTQAGTKVFGYVDSSVTDSGRPYWNPAWTSDGTDTGTPTAAAPAWLKTGVTNPFGITTDIRDAAWKQIVIDQCVDLVSRGYSGIFLDDVAQYYALGLKLGNADQWARAMMDLVSSVKDAITAVNPAAQLIVNSTPYITSDAGNSPASQASVSQFLSKADAMMLEVFFGISFAPEEFAIQQAVNAIRPYMSVITLEYGGTPYQNYLYKTQAEAMGFVPGFSVDATYSSFGSTVSPSTNADDVLQGTRRADVITGFAGNDTMSGGDGADKIDSGIGNDTINGDAGNDTLTGGSGDDNLNGGDGNDVFYGGSGIDRMDGGNGIDRVSYIKSSAITVNLLTNINSGGDAQGDALFGIEEVAGSFQSDIITGNDQNNWLFGDRGNDRLAGGKGVDILAGGAGSDTLVFALGDTGQTAATADVIKNFGKGAVGVGDMIDFSATLSIGGTAAAATATQASINAVNGVASFAAGSGTSMADALSDLATSFTTGGDASGEFAFFQVQNAGDFYMLISDGVAGLGPNDVLIDLGQVRSINTINLTNGDLTILS